METPKVPHLCCWNQGPTQREAAHSGLCCVSALPASWSLSQVSLTRALLWALLWTLRWPGDSAHRECSLAYLDGPRPGFHRVLGCQAPRPGCFPAWWGLGSGRGRAPQWRLLVSEAWRWWPFCCPTTIHEWFVVLGCTLPGGTRHRAPTAPAQRDPG